MLGVMILTSLLGSSGAVRLCLSMCLGYSLYWYPDLSSSSAISIQGSLHILVAHMPSQFMYMGLFRSPRTSSRCLQNTQYIPVTKLGELVRKSGYDPYLCFTPPFFLMFHVLRILTCLLFLSLFKVFADTLCAEYFARYWGLTRE